MKYAGFWVRVVANLADNFVVYIASLVLTRLTLGIVFLILRPAPTFGEAFSGSLIQIVGMGSSLTLGFAYAVWMHYRYGQTFGKRMMGIIVRDEESSGPISLGQSVGRYFAHWVSGLTLGIGYLMAAWSPRKKGLHDHLAGTIVIYGRAAGEAILLPEKPMTSEPKSSDPSGNSV